MTIKKEDVKRLATLARLTVKGPTKMVKVYNLGGFNDFEYASVLIENIRKHKNIILIARNLSESPIGTVEWLIGRALTWALENRKKEKAFRKYLRNRESKRYEEYMKRKAEEDQKREDEEDKYAIYCG